MIDEDYVFDLLNYIADLQVRIDQLEEENAELHRQNQSWQLWMNRSIDRIKQIQS